MQILARRGLAWLLAMALVIAGLPVAHAMPVAASHHAKTMAISAGHAHHCDDMAMEALPPDGDSQPHELAPCKCLNCSMGVAGFTPLLRMSIPERRAMAVVYAIDAAHLAGIAAPIDPGIPILIT
jgi:hypothetical protein